MLSVSGSTNLRWLDVVDVDIAIGLGLALLVLIGVALYLSHVRGA